MVVWKCFKVTGSDTGALICFKCGPKLSRDGTSAKTFGTTAWVFYLNTQNRTTNTRERETAAAKRKASSVLEKTKKFANTSAKGDGV